MGHPVIEQPSRNEAGFRKEQERKWCQAPALPAAAGKPESARRTAALQKAKQIPRRPSEKRSGLARNDNVVV